MAEEAQQSSADVEPTPIRRSSETAWAQPIDHIRLEATTGGIRANVDGRVLVGPLQGFGQMWQKTYRVRLVGSSATPAEVVKAWRGNFGRFWPTFNRFYGKLGALSPGDVALLNLGVAPGVGGIVLSTGVMVVFADDESFAFMTPRGHMYASIITFSAYREEDGTTVAQVQPLLRASDPLIELLCRLRYGHWIEDIHWHYVLKTLAASFGAADAKVDQQNLLVDPRCQWSEIRNVFYNPAIQTALYVVGTPFRWARQALAGGRAAVGPGQRR